jgi:hypothetical protein
MNIKQRRAIKMHGNDYAIQGGININTIQFIVMLRAIFETLYTITADTVLA